MAEAAPLTAGDHLRSLDDTLAEIRGLSRAVLCLGVAMEKHPGEELAGMDLGLEALSSAIEALTKQGDASVEALMALGCGRPAG